MGAGTGAIIIMGAGAGAGPKLIFSDCCQSSEGALIAGSAVSDARPALGSSGGMYIAANWSGDAVATSGLFFSTA